MGLIARPGKGLGSRTYKNQKLITCDLDFNFDEKNYEISTRCVLKHKCPRTRPIPEVAIIVKTKIQGEDVKI
jgi:hypothetical protein